MPASTAPLTFQSLSPARRRLITLCQRVNFGHIESLPIQSGEPILEPPPRTFRDIKFGSENGPRPESTAKDFALKARVTDFFGHLDQFQDCVIERLEVQHGLPFRMLVADDSQLTD